MDQPPSPAKSRLAAIARNAMQERGLLPEFSPAAIAELKTVAQMGKAAVAPNSREPNDLGSSKPSHATAVVVPL